MDSPFCVPPRIYLCALINLSVVKAPNWSFRQRLQNICSTHSLRNWLQEFWLWRSLVLWRLKLLKRTGVRTELASRKSASPVGLSQCQGEELHKKIWVQPVAGTVLNSTEAHILGRGFILVLHHFGTQKSGGSQLPRHSRSPHLLSVPVNQFSALRNRDNCKKQGRLGFNAGDTLVLRQGKHLLCKP